MSGAGGDRRRRPDDPPPRGRGRDDDPDAPERRPKFFLAVFQGGFSEARVFRAYPDGDSVLFVYAGPAPAFLDVEVARNAGRGDWKAKMARTLKTSLVSAGGAVLIGLAVLTAILGRLAIRDGSNITDIIAMVLGIGTVVAIGLVVALTGALRRLLKRVDLLDTLSREDLRDEARRDKQSFVATEDNVKGVRIDPPDGSSRGGAAAYLSFRHKPTGKWKMNLMTRQDARAAARAFRDLLGHHEVEVNLQLIKD
jgi:hypothetical protein